MTAPSLFEESQDSHCFVRRQPDSEAELYRMLQVLATQELGCVRYRGRDDAMLRRIAEAGGAKLCDVTPPAGVEPVRRDHVSFVADAREERWTARELLERLAHFWRARSARYRAFAIVDTATLARPCCDQHGRPLRGQLGAPMPDT
jgi:hypothetical protein